MGKLDLGNPIDFARATNSAAANVLALLTGIDQSKWDIDEGAFNGVLFHVFSTKTNYGGALDQVVDTGGRRKVRYAFPYKDGQTTDDLGRKANDFEFNILLHGVNYFQALDALLIELDKATPGKLSHPVMGVIDAVPTEWTITHSSSARQAAALKVTFTEQTFTIGNLTVFSEKTVKSALASALAFFAKVDALILRVQGATILAQAVKNAFVEALETYKSAFGTTLTRLNQTFNDTGSADIPSLLPVNQGGTGSPGSGTNFPLVASPTDPFAAVPQDLLDAQTLLALAVEQLQKEVAALRTDVNTIIDLLSASANGAGALEFYEEILDLKDSAIQMQAVLETGIASSQARIIEYVTPQIMSLREVAFANGISLERVSELDQLNTFLQSTNYIEAGVSLRVPVS